jgi:hypothetical protein
MRLRSVTAIAAVSLAASAAAAQGIFDPPAEQAGGPASVVAIPHDAAEPFASLVIDETIRLAPPASAPPPGPTAPAAAPSYIGPGPTIVAPTPNRDPASASAVPNGHAAIDAGPTFVPPISTFLLRRPGYDVPASK